MIDYSTFPILHDQMHTYNGFLLPRKYVGKLQQGIILITEESAPLLSRMHFDEKWVMNPELTDMEELVTYEADMLSEGMLSLKAQYNIAMGGVLVIFEMARGSFRAGLNTVFEKMQGLMKSDAENRFREAMKFYRDACRTAEQQDQFSESLRLFSKSIEDYRENAFAYLHMGHILHYHRKQRDFKRAMEYYSLCFTAAELFEEQMQVAAQGYFYSGWVSSAVYGDIQSGIDLTIKAIEMEPRMSEAYYNLAKFYAAFGDEDEASAQLREAIETFDRRYCLKVEKDSDFSAIRDEIRRLFYEIAENDIAECERLFQENTSRLSDVLKMHVEDKLNYAKKLLNTNDYLQHKDIMLLIDELKEKINQETINSDESEQQKKQKEQSAQKQQQEAEDQERRAEEERMKAELAKRIEEEMKARIAAQEERQRKRTVAQAVFSNLFLLLLVLTIAAFAVYGLTVWGFLLLLSTSLTLLVRLLL